MRLRSLMLPCVRNIPFSVSPSKELRLESLIVRLDREAKRKGALQAIDVITVRIVPIGGFRVA